jgi:anti-anti-sigma factor
MGARSEALSEINLEGFSAHTEHRPDSIVVSLKGNADMAVQEKLRVFLDSLASLSQLPTVKEAVFDLGELYFMNSSCLSLLLRFINRVLEFPNDRRPRVRFRSNPNLQWQKKSLQALHAYAQEVVVVE